MPIAPFRTPFEVVKPPKFVIAIGLLVFRNIGAMVLIPSLPSIT